MIDYYALSSTTDESQVIVTSVAKEDNEGKIPLWTAKTPKY